MPPNFFGNVQPAKTFPAQYVVILARVGAVAVMFPRPGGKVGRQLPAALLQAPLIFADLKIHPLALPSD
jgi:hypothetical protein